MVTARLAYAERRRLTAAAGFRARVGLHDCGVSETDLRKMVRDNPARLLGLN